MSVTARWRSRPSACTRGRCVRCGTAARRPTGRWAASPEPRSGRSAAGGQTDTYSRFIHFMEEGSVWTLISYEDKDRQTEAEHLNIIWMFWSVWSPSAFMWIILNNYLNVLSINCVFRVELFLCLVKRDFLNLSGIVPANKI